MEGQDFDSTGMVVTATYNDESSEEITEYTITDGEKLTAGKETVTISYTEDEITKTATQEITVNVETEEMKFNDENLYNVIKDKSAFGELGETIEIIEYNDEEKTIKMSKADIEKVTSCK